MAKTLSTKHGNVEFNMQFLFLTLAYFNQSRHWHGFHIRIPATHMNDCIAIKKKKTEMVFKILLASRNQAVVLISKTVMAVTYPNPKKGKEKKNRKLRFCSLIKWQSYLTLWFLFYVYFYS